MKRAFLLGILILFCLPINGRAQNCCAPAVAPQGISGETVTLPHTLDIGLHYEYLRSRQMYCGSTEVDDPAGTEADWKRLTVGASYGITRSLSVSLILPYVWNQKDKDVIGYGRLEMKADGIGDMLCIVRFSPLSRSFVTYRELSIGLGVKMPTGEVDKGFLLPEELQPGTGSWDYHASLSFYQGFELVDFFAAGTYALTTSYEGYEFGNRFSYLATASFHIKSRLDLSLGISGMVRGKDHRDGVEELSTGRHQTWLVPGIQFQAIPGVLRLQVYYEEPVYQHFNDVQLGSDGNIRVTVVGTIPLKEPDEDD